MDNKNRSELPSFLLDYKDYIQNTRRLSPKTVKEYMLDLSLFFRFLLVYKVEKDFTKDNFPALVHKCDLTLLTNEMIKETSWDNVQNFLAYYVGILKNNERSQKRKLVAIRRFFDYLLISKKISANPVGDIEIRTPKKQPISLTEEQIVLKLQPVIQNYEGPYKERNKAIMVLFIELGLRLSELVSINLNDINEDNILIRGKGKKERLLPLNDTCLNAINNYLKVRPKSYEIKIGHQDALFISRMKRRISTRTVQLIVDQFLDLANVNTKEKKFTTHKLRHSFATILADKGVSVHDIQEFLGHESLSTTSVYVNSKYKRLRDVKEKFPIFKKDN